MRNFFLSYLSMIWKARNAKIILCFVVGPVGRGCKVLFESVQALLSVTWSSSCSWIASLKSVSKCEGLIAVYCIILFVFPRLICDSGRDPKLLAVNL
ncbi:hypothetical protein QL285_090753 [Trifolium repens]|nr:hypothetical protein QL285_090753 [Trifolium repens]